jgi:hypothetical protein
MLGYSLKVSAADYPAPIVFYKMSHAGLLQGLSVDTDTSGSRTIVAITDDARLRKFEAQYPGKLTAKFRNVPVSFARLLAKIGYCQVLCSLDIHEFNPICLPYILGEKANLSYVVGGRSTIDKPQPGIGYTLSSNRVGTSDRMLIVAEVRLFADNHTPTYHVVVGDVIGSERVSQVQKKLQATYAVEISVDIKWPENLSDELHWMPRLWPLPYWSV